jgi:hypothetical protein
MTDWLDAGLFLFALIVLLFFMWERARYTTSSPATWRLMLFRCIATMFAGVCVFIAWIDPWPPAPWLFGGIATAIGFGYVWLIVRMRQLWGAAHRPTQS